MNSIHQSESYTALLSFSVKFCLGGLTEPCCSRGRCPASWALSKRFPEDARYCRTNQWPSSGDPPGALLTLGQAKGVAGCPDF